MKTRIIGIDPGKNGGLAVIYEDGRVYAWGGLPDSDWIDTLRSLSVVESNIQVIAYLEQVGGFIGKQQPGSAMFRFGESFGFIRGVLQTLAISTELVRPQAWQKSLVGLAGLEGQARKRALREHASRLFPSIKPTLATADALLIARYGAAERRCLS